MYFVKEKLNLKKIIFVTTGSVLSMVGVHQDFVKKLKMIQSATLIFYRIFVSFIKVFSAVNWNCIWKKLRKPS